MEFFLVDSWAFWWSHKSENIDFILLMDFLAPSCALSSSKWIDLKSLRKCYQWMFKSNPFMPRITINNIKAFCKSSEFSNLSLFLYKMDMIGFLFNYLLKIVVYVLLLKKLKKWFIQMKSLKWIPMLKEKGLYSDSWFFFSKYIQQYRVQYHFLEYLEISFFSLWNLSKTVQLIEY